MKSAKPTYCPHCWTELTADDTTCYQCGEKVEKAIVKSTPSSKNDWTKESLRKKDFQKLLGDDFAREWHESQPKRHQRKIVSAIFYVAVLACAVLFTMWAAGELVL